MQEHWKDLCDFGNQQQHLAWDALWVKQVISGGRREMGFLQIAFDDNDNIGAEAKRSQMKKTQSLFKSWFLGKFNLMSNNRWHVLTMKRAISGQWLF